MSRFSVNKYLNLNLFLRQNIASVINHFDDTETRLSKIFLKRKKKTFYVTRRNKNSYGFGIT